MTGRRYWYILKFLFTSFKFKISSCLNKLRVLSDQMAYQQLKYFVNLGDPSSLYELDRICKQGNSLISADENLAEKYFSAAIQQGFLVIDKKDKKS